jgi:rod shape determining protein RodA
MIHSATASAMQGDVRLWDNPVVRQGVFALAGMAALVALSLLNYRVLGAWRWVFYAATLALLVLVWLTTRGSFGARSWFDLGGSNLQPSEFAKLVMIIVLARYFADHQEQVKKGTGIFVSFLITLPMLGLIYVEPDMGTAAIVAAIWFGMLFVAGIRPQWIILLALAAIVVAPIGWSVMQPHMRERIMMFLQPAADPLGRDYNVIQALISVGSGGLWGKGLGQGTQSQLFFLRVRHTDFIFAVLAEELGFVGALILLTLFAVLLLRIIRISSRAGDAYGRLIASGVGIMILVQVAINIGFHIKLFPVTGLPLPLISYGGSSLLTTLAGLGLVESVARYHTPPEFA